MPVDRPIPRAPLQAMVALIDSTAAVFAPLHSPATDFPALGLSTTRKGVQSLKYSS